MSCQDAILWIGKSYAEILCGKIPEYDYCPIDEKKKKKERCYVHEAELRGCCRKIPDIYDWLIPEKSRIFLVHKDGHEEKTRGSLFGYFILKRFEFVVNPEVSKIIENGSTIPWPKRTYQYIAETVSKEIEKSKIDILDEKDRQKLEEKVQKKMEKFAQKKPVQKRTKNYLSQLIKGDYIEPMKPTETPTDPSGLLEDLVKNLLQDFVEDLIGDKWEEFQKGNKYAFVPWTSSQLEGHRSCSKRLKVNSIYLVYALTAEITDSFIKKLSKNTPSTTEEGEKLFKETVYEVRENRKGKSTLTTIHPSLEDYAEMYGELVLFKKPYPIFERTPESVFRGLLQVDGDTLMGEICKCYNGEGYIPEIPYCEQDDEKSKEKRTDEQKDEKKWTVSRLASEFGFNKTKARAILYLFDKRIEQVESGDIAELVLPGVGTFEMRNGKLVFTNA